MFVYKLVTSAYTNGKTTLFVSGVIPCICCEPIANLTSLGV